MARLTIAQLRDIIDEQLANDATKMLLAVDGHGNLSVAVGSQHWMLRCTEVCPHCFIEEAIDRLGYPESKSLNLRLAYRTNVSIGTVVRLLLSRSRAGQAWTLKFVESRHAKVFKRRVCQLHT